MKTIETDLAVVGAGVIGASCAYHATKRGLKVAIFDSHTPAAGTSSACDGYIAISSKKPGLMMDLAVATKAVYADIVKDLRIDPEYHASGGLLICEDEPTAEKVAPHAETIRSLGTEITFLDRHRMLELEPYLSAELFGAYYIPNEALVNPYRWNFALVDRAVARGARTFWATPPIGFDLAGKRIAAMNTHAGKIVAEQFVFAVGVWSRPLGNLVGIDIPVIPRRGEVVVTERGAAVTNRKLLSAKYLTVKGDPEAVARSTDPVMRLGHGFSLEVTAQGQAIVGGTRGFVGYDRRVTPEGITTIIREAIRRVPALARVQALRAYAGLRPFVPDMKPIIGRSGLVENLLVATGHEGDGISLSAITGEIVADLATGRTPRIDVATLTPDRFGAAKEAPVEAVDRR